MKARPVFLIAAWLAAAACMFHLMAFGAADGKVFWSAWNACFGVLSLFSAFLTAAQVIVRAAFDQLHSEDDQP